MEKKLLFSEAIMIIIVIGTFLIIFSMKNGWGLEGTERYSTATLAAILATLVAAVVLVIATAAGITTLAITAGITTLATAVTAALAADVTVAAIVFTILVALAATDVKGLKSPFAIISLIVEVALIFVTITAITFWIQLSQILK